MSTSVRVTRDKAEKVLRLVGDDTEIKEALGLVPYWGWDSARAAHRQQRVKCLREPEFVDDESQEGLGDTGLDTRFTNVD